MFSRLQKNGDSLYRQLLDKLETKVVKFKLKTFALKKIFNINQRTLKMIIEVIFKCRKIYNKLLTFGGLNGYSEEK